MMPISVVGLFCEDIREEKAGSTTLIGIMPDNALVPPAPGGTLGAMSKLCIYIRIHFDPMDDLGDITSKLILPDGNVIDLQGLERNVVEKAINDARTAGAPIAGLILRVETSPFTIVSFGRMTVELKIKSQTFMACALNFVPMENKAT